ncbi:MAG: GLUG motif-containing protein [Balneolaceae bacterium]|nr:GLUG motif-containing protein [Balneolaceae bacterium]
MKKCILNILVFLLISCVNNSESETQFEGGTGTEENPYQIATVEQLQQIGEEQNLDKHFLQVKDIDASETADFNDGDGFQPIGNQATPFTGSYNGNGFMISELTIHVFQKHSGMFGYVKDGLIENVHLENSGETTCTLEEKEITVNKKPNHSKATDDIIIIEDIYGGGWLVGFNDGGTIRNSSVVGDYNNRYLQLTHTGGVVGFNMGLIENSRTDGQIVGRGFVGGLAGGNSGEIIHSNAIGCTSTAAGRAGGLVGYNGGPTGEISNSYASSTILGGYGSGGLVAIQSGIVTESYSSGQVLAFGDASGGLVGINTGAVTNSYSISEIREISENGTEYIGGLVGINREDGYIAVSYYAGSLPINEELIVGGFTGLNYGEIYSAFWDSEKSGLSIGSGEGRIEGITGLGTDQMTGPAAETSMPLFSWGTTWKTTSGYPILMWQEESSDE